MDSHDSPTSRGRSSRPPTTGDRPESGTETQSFWTAERAQTSIDLLFAVMIFFSAIALITVQTPGLFFPDNYSGTDTTSEADRIAHELTTTELRTVGSTVVTNESLVTFLATNESEFNSMFNVSEDRALQIRVTTPDTRRGPPTALDPDFNSGYNVQNGSGSYYVVKGEDGTPPESQIVSVPVTVDDRLVTIEVGVWYQ